MKEFLFQNESDKIAALKNSININPIKYFIIAKIEKFELNEIKHFELAINWIDDYLKLNSISKMFNDISQISLVNYFSYLYIWCDIIMNWLRKIEDIIIFSRYLKEKYLFFNIRLKIIRMKKMQNKNLLNLYIYIVPQL